MQGRNLLLAVASFALPFGVYIVTTSPTVPFGDSGELIVAACTLGVPHPPGFPLYTMLGKLFCLLPFGSAAWRVNLMSGFFGAATCFVLFYFLKRLGCYPLIALVSAWALAFSKLFWSQSVIAEVYTLHTFLLALLFLLALQLRNTSPPKPLWLFGLVLGLAFANHWTLMVLSLIPLLVLLWPFFKREGWFAPTAKIFLFFLVGLLPYIYLPLSSLSSPPIDWNHPRTLPNFLLHVLRWNTGEHRGDFMLSNTLKMTKVFWDEILVKDFTLLGPLLAILGLQMSWDRLRGVVWSLGLVWLLHSLVTLLWVRSPFTGYNAYSILVTFLPLSFAMACLIGIGLQSLYTRLFLPKEIPPQSSQNPLQNPV